jgi:hypothetical protein
MPGQHDIDLSIGVSGAQKSKKDLEGVGRSAEKIGAKTERGTRRASTAMTSLKTSIGGLAARFLSITAIVAGVGKSVASEFENMAKASENASKRIRASLDLLFLGEFAKKHPNLQTELSKFAQQAALPGVEGKVEVAKAFELIVSKTPSATDAQQTQLLQSALQLRRTTETPLSTLSNLLVQLQKSAPGATPTQLSNLILQAKTEAGSTTGEMAQRLPELLGIGEAGGLTVPQTTGLFAVGTGRLGAARATSGLRLLISRLRGKELTPEGEAIKGRVGLQPGQDIIQQMQSLSTAFKEGRLQLPEIQELFGEEAGPLAALVIPEFAAFQASTEKIRAAFVSPTDIVGKKIEEIVKPGSLEERVESLRRAQAGTESVQFELDAARGIEAELVGERTYQALRREGVPHFLAAAQAFGAKTSAKLSPPTGELAELAQLTGPQFEEALETPGALTAAPLGGVFGGTAINVNYNFNRTGNPAQQGEPTAPPAP